MSGPWFLLLCGQPQCAADQDMFQVYGSTPVAYVCAREFVDAGGEQEQRLLRHLDAAAFEASPVAPREPADAGVTLADHRRPFEQVDPGELRLLVKRLQVGPQAEPQLLTPVRGPAYSVAHAGREHIDPRPVGGGQAGLLGLEQL